MIQAYTPASPSRRYSVLVALASVVAVAVAASAPLIRGERGARSLSSGFFAYGARVHYRAPECVPPSGGPPMERRRGARPRPCSVPVSAAPPPRRRRARRDPGASGDPPRFGPAQGDRADRTELDSRRGPSVWQLAGTCSSRRRASTASPLRHARICRPGNDAGPQVRGEPRAPRFAWGTGAKGPATLNQLTDPDRILYPLKLSALEGEGRRAASGGTRSSTRWRRTSGRHRRGAPERDHDPPRSSRGCTFTSGCLRAGALTATTRTRTSARGVDRLPFWMGIDRPSPIMPTPR